MSEMCEVVAYVRSERIAVSAREVRVTRPVPISLAGPSYDTVLGVRVVYGLRLPREHAAALSEARRLAAETRGAVRVVDLGQSNALARVLRLWFLGEPALPAVVVKGACRWAGLGTEPGPRTTRPETA